MPPRVLKIKADSRGGQAEEHGEGKGLPPRLGSEHQQEIGRDQDGNENPGLHVHLSAVARLASRRPKNSLDPPPELHVKPIAHAEFHRSARLVCGHLARLPRPSKRSDTNHERHIREPGSSPSAVRSRVLIPGRDSLPAKIRKSAIPKGSV